MEQNEARQAAWLFLASESHLRQEDSVSHFLLGKKHLSAYGRELITKAAVLPMDSTGGLASSSPMARAILDLVDQRAILPQLGAARAPGVKVVGAVEVSDPTAAFVAEGAPAPMSAASFTSVALDAKKIVGAIAVSKELLKFGHPRDTQILFERRLTTAIAKAWNSALLDTAAATTARPVC
ncbi:MAG TPA: phage major capsid protein [Vicinamibacterales bacterium]|nr:phage major capsid protein [Vicinamibacterales bacterium]